MDQRVFQGMEYVYQVYKEGSFLKASEKVVELRHFFVITLVAPV